MYHGYRLLGVAVVTNFVSMPFLLYSYGVLFKALTAEFGGSRLGVATGVSIFQLAAAAFAPFLGRIVDRRSIRAVMLAGGISLALGFALATRITALWQWYLLLATLIGLGAASVGGLPTSTLVANWFVRRRGFALGIAATGVSLSGFVMAPTATLLIGAYGWRGAFGIYAVCIALFVLPLIAIWVRRPAPSELAASGELVEEGGEGDRQAQVPRWSARRILGARNFWVITMATGFNFSTNGALLTHLIPHTTDLGFASAPAALLVSVIAGAAVCGKLAFGWAIDRFDKRLGAAVANSLQITTLIVLTRSESYPLLMAAGAVYGFGLGGQIPIWSSMIGEAFGRRAFGRATGLSSFFMVPIQTASAPLAGYLYDRTGSYDTAFQVLVLNLVVALGVVLAFRPARAADTTPPSAGGSATGGA